MIEKDVYVESFLKPIRFEVPQGSNAQKLKFYFRDFTPSGTCYIYLHKPSGKEIYNVASASSMSSSPPYCQFNLTTQMTAEVGDIVGQLRVVSGSTILNSFPIVMHCVASPIVGSSVESKDEFTALDEALGKVDTATSAAETATENANNAASKATAATTNANNATSSANDAATDATQAAQEARTAVKSTSGLVISIDADDYGLNIEYVE